MPSSIPEAKTEDKKSDEKSQISLNKFAEAKPA